MTPPCRGVQLGAAAECDALTGDVSSSPSWLTLLTWHAHVAPQEGNGAAARANGAAAKAAEAGDSDDEELVENNPELHPLKEALQRARMRLEEATGIRCVCVKGRAGQAG